MFARRIPALLGLALLVTAGPAASDAEPAAANGAGEGKDALLQAAVSALVRDRSLAGAQIGVEVVELASGRVLASSGEHDLLNPASNAKIYTAAAALALLHGSHRYQTTLSATIKSGAVQGPLVLRGHGDPSFATKDLWHMVHELRARGVRRVEGDVLVDQRFFDDQSTPPAFEQQPNEWAAFRAPVAPVSVNENTVTLTVRAGASGDAAQTEFDPPGYVDVEGSVKTNESGADNVVLSLTPNGKRLLAKVGGTVPEDSRLVRYTRRVDDPSLLAGFALKAILEESGIKVSGEVKPGSVAKPPVVVKHESEPLSSLLYSVGKSSDNFYAEMIFKSLSGELHSRPAKSGESAEIVAKFLEKNHLGDPGIVVKNGSGLFDANRVTTHSLAAVLRYAYNDPAIASEFVSQLAIGGADGTLHKRFHAYRAERSIRAKTGTLDDVIALSGYVLAPPGRAGSAVAFSIVLNKVSGKGSSARSAADELVTQIHARVWAKRP